MTSSARPRRSGRHPRTHRQTADRRASEPRRPRRTTCAAAARIVRRPTRREPPESNRSTRAARGGSTAPRPTRTRIESPTTDRRTRTHAVTRSPAVDCPHRGRHAPSIDYPTTKTPPSWSKNARTELPRRRPRRGRSVPRRKQHRSHTCIVRTTTAASFAHRLPAVVERRVAVRHPNRRRAGPDTDSTQWLPVHVAAPKSSSSSRSRRRAEVVAVVLLESLSVALPRDSHSKRPATDRSANRGEPADAGGFASK